VSWFNLAIRTISYKAVMKINHCIEAVVKLSKIIEWIKAEKVRAVTIAKDLDGNGVTQKILESRFYNFWRENGWVKFGIPCSTAIPAHPMAIQRNQLIINKILL